MVTVYVWKFRGKNIAWGHASMLVDGGVPKGDVYISWWPAAQGRVSKIPYTAGTPLANIYNAPAIRGRQYIDDVSDEGQPPDYTCQLNGLDETAIKKWFDDLVKSGDPWSTLGGNCSTTVARALKAGGADDYAKGFSGWWNSWHIVWRPNDIIDYCEALKRGGL